MYHLSKAHYCVNQLGMVKVVINFIMRRDLCVCTHEAMKKYL